MKDEKQYSLLAHNTFGIDAQCDRFINFETTDEIIATLPTLSETDKPLLIIGSGANLLLVGNYHGTVLHVDIKGVEFCRQEDSILVRCGAGENWDNVVAQCVNNGFHGAENLSLIPSEVGATAVQNIGAYGVEAKDIIHKVEAIEVATAKPVVFFNEDCEFGYRQSKFKREWKDRFLITHVTYRLHYQFNPKLDYGNIRTELGNRGITEPTAAQLRQCIIDIRRSKLPNTAIEGNAGSFFVNPVVTRQKFEELIQSYPDMPHYSVSTDGEKIPAGWLIEQTGWKGKTLGRAGVHSKQALVLVNRGGATGQEVLTLCETIRTDVQKKFGIELTPEVNIKGSI